MDIGHVLKRSFRTAVVLCTIATANVGGATVSGAGSNGASPPSSILASTALQAPTNTQLLDGRRLLIGGFKFGSASDAVVVQDAPALAGKSDQSDSPSMKLIYP